MSRCVQGPVERPLCAREETRAPSSEGGLSPRSRRRMNLFSFFKARHKYDRVMGATKKTSFICIPREEEEENDR